MKKYIILFDPRAQQDMLDFDHSTARMIRNTLVKKLGQAPLEYGAPLFGILGGYRKLKISKYRVVYTVKNELIEVHIVAVGHRRDEEVYDIATKRIQNQ